MKTGKRLLPVLLLLALLAGCGAPKTVGPGEPAATDQNTAVSPTAERKVLNVGRTSELFEMNATVATEADCMEIITAVMVRPGVSGLEFFPVGVGTIYKYADVDF